MSLLSRFTIRTKLASMVVVSAISVCAIIAVSASLSQKRMLEDRMGQLHTAAA
jgi:methyl-accepting chemotaxis protein